MYTIFASIYFPSHSRPWAWMMLRFNLHVRSNSGAALRTQISGIFVAAWLSVISGHFSGNISGIIMD